MPLAAAVNVAVDPAVTLLLAGLVVTVGPKFTVRVAAVVVAEPTLFVNTARYLFPFCVAVAENESVGEVAPATLVKFTPSVLTCHCTVGAGLPLAAAVNVAVDPAFTVEFPGLLVMTGPAVTVNVAAVLVAELMLLVNTALNRLPFCIATAPNDSVVEVAPAIFVKVTPSVLCCHCTVGAGLPLAAAVNVAVAPAATLILAGLVVIAGAKFTVSVAAVVVAEPRVLVNTARYRFPFCAAATADTDKVVEVAPETLLNVTPSVLTCHCTVGVGTPLAAAVKVAVAPAFTVVLDGLVVMSGPAVTVSVAAVVVAELTLLVKVARY